VYLWHAKWYACHHVYKTTQHQSISNTAASQQVTEYIMRTLRNSIRWHQQGFQAAAEVSSWSAVTWHSVGCHVSAVLTVTLPASSQQHYINTPTDTLLSQHYINTPTDTLLSRVSCINNCDIACFLSATLHQHTNRHSPLTCQLY